MRSAFGEDRSEILARVRGLDLRELLGRAGADHHPTIFTALWSEIDQIVGGLDDVQIVLDDEQRMPRLEQLPECRQQLREVVEVQAGGRLIENVQQPRPISSST